MSTPPSHPQVTVVMPVLNEERHLREAVDAVLDQDYAGDLDVVLALGPSRDRTDEVAAALAAGDPRIRLVQNPTGRTPNGLNAAIALATGEVVVRVDGHAVLPRGYVAAAVRALEDTGADNVGGIMAAEGATPFERTVARAMTSRLGVGSAAFHVGGTAGPAETVYLGAFRRSALTPVGGYDERFTRAQDWEMNHRIRSTGGLVWFEPAMRVSYRPRAGFRALARQYRDYGRWRRVVMRAHPQTISLRYLAAPVAVAAIALGTVAGAVGLLLGVPWLLVGFAAPVGYAALVVVGGLAEGGGLRPGERLRLPAVLATMHLCWGYGFLTSVTNPLK
jgi:glycosyltransferase involved in cell wall biosynthesis